jgi:hypothetical protein
MYNVDDCRRPAIRRKSHCPNPKSRRLAFQHRSVRRDRARFGSGAIPLTPGAPSSTGNDIVVVELSTNGGSGASGNVNLNVAAIGIYSVATTSCTLGASPVAIVRPASGAGTADLCLFSVSGLDPSFTYTISGPATPDITVTAREPLGLGIVHLTLQVPSTAPTGPRTLFVENLNKDKAAATGAIEVR